MEVIEREDLKALNIELFRSKLYFRLDLKEGDETTALIEAPGSGAGKAEEACEKDSGQSSAKISHFFSWKRWKVLLSR